VIGSVRPAGKGDDQRKRGARSPKQAPLLHLRIASRHGGAAGGKTPRL